MDGREYESIAISSGRGDAGVFELSLGDDHYLPFEGRGLIATACWRADSQ
jgi:hypothetical protein